MASFNDDDHFTIANIPFGVVSLADQKRQIATRLHGDVYILTELLPLLEDVADEAVRSVQQTTLNDFAALPRAVRAGFRSQVQALLASGKAQQYAVRLSEVDMHLPVHIGDFSDFSCSKDHVLNASEAMTGTKSIPPGFLHFPVGYTGRSASIVVSGTSVKRPNGQYRDAGNVVYGSSKALDFELEVGAVIGRPSTQGVPITMAEADEHIFGFVLVNDWSARDIQGLEMIPLGPFSGKSFATSMSPWIVTVEAFEPFACPAETKEVAPYLADFKASPLYDVALQVDLVTAQQHETLCKTNINSLHWSFRDMLVQQTANGCPVRSGDLLATGTISGSSAGSLACLLEITKDGKVPLTLSSGEVRTYLQDRDSIRLLGWAGELGTDKAVGFGQCFGILLP